MSAFLTVFRLNLSPKQWDSECVNNLPVPLTVIWTQAKCKKFLAFYTFLALKMGFKLENPNDFASGIAYALEIRKNSMKSTKIKSWERREADMTVKIEMHQDGPEAFEVACWKLGASIPVLYRFKTLNEVSNYYSFWIAKKTAIEALMQAEICELHKLCAAAQCWLDAAGFLAKGHATKCALQKNADEFRNQYAKIMS